MMKRVFAYDRIITAFSAVILSIMIHASCGYAVSAIDLVMDDWHPAEIKGIIMSVDKEFDSMVVNEVRILLADTVTKNGKICATRIMNEYGKEVSRRELKQGKFVYIKVGTALDPDKRVEYVVAKDIYILKHAMSRRGMENRGIPMGPVTPW
jgi:hypothetical protein